MKSFYNSIILMSVAFYFSIIHANTISAQPSYSWNKSLLFDSATANGGPLPTQTMNLCPHGGELFAGMSTDHEENRYSRSASYVYRKVSPIADWVLDMAFEPGSGRVASLRSVRFETGADGLPLSCGPMDILFAGTNREGNTIAPAVVRLRKGPGDWISIPLGSTSIGTYNIRAIGYHRDSQTGVDRVFVAAGPYPLGIFSGVYDPTQPGGVKFDALPEVAEESSGNGKWFGLAEANGKLYAAHNDGLFERLDGPMPSWVKVATWPRPTPGSIIGEVNVEPRGLAGVQSIGFPEPQMLFVSRLDALWRVRAGGDYQIVQELDMDSAIAASIGYNVANAEGPMNPLVPIPVAGSGDTVWLIGVEFVFGDLDENHLVPPRDPMSQGDMSSATTFSSVAHYFIRFRDGSYSGPHRIIDPVDTSRMLILARDMVPSPFASEPDVVYAAGFNPSSLKGVGGSGTNGRAWIYKGVLQSPVTGVDDFSYFGETILIYPNPANNLVTITGLDNGFIGSISIYNAMGQVLLSEKKTGSQLSIETGNLNSGIYFINIKTEKGELITRIFIKE